MPNEVINQLAAACKKYKGIVFTNKDGNIINDQNDDSEGNLEITGVNEQTHEEITGVNEETYSPGAETYSPGAETYSPGAEIYSHGEEIYSPGEETYTTRHLHHRSGTKQYSTTQKPRRFSGL